MLTLYRRHLTECPHTSMRYKRCRCPIWVFGSLNGNQIRRSLDLLNWEAAQALIRDWEVEGSIEKDVTTVAAACELFTKDCESRFLSDATVGKYKLLFRELKQHYGPWHLKALSTAELDECRGKWKLSPISARKKLERLRTFFKFCVDRDLLRKNPAASLKPPQTRLTPTLPFTDEDMKKILKATEAYPIKGIYREGNKERIRAFVLLLRYSGLRIRDAVCLERARIKDGKLFLYTQKTGTAVRLPLPHKVIDALKKLPTTSSYFFWSGNGLPKSAVADWQRSLAKLFLLANINGHAHRFRDTFSVSLLEAGVPLETVATLLGHQSIKTTERHYAPWVKSRQVRLEESIRKAWKA